MKKYLLSISLILLFFISYSGTADQFPNRTSSIAFQVNENDYSANFLNYPHTELEVSQHTVGFNSIGRNQNFSGFICAAIAFGFDGNLCSFLINGASFNCSCKNYLSHIYPSHNFW